ncbi:MAG TPA: hypothetical protein VFJ77_06555 [Gaiellaceae bacterium]|nr:hypothetical protein [Gaiellaceae bacterium]
MQLVLNDPAYTDRLAAFLASLGQDAIVDGSGGLTVAASGDEADRLELEIYLRVWRVLYPEADVQLAA